MNTSRPNSPLKVNTLTNSKTNRKEPVIGATTTVDKLPDQENQEGSCLRGEEGNCGPVGAACTNERLCNDLAPDGFFKGRALRNGIALLIRLAIAFCNAVRGPFLFRPHTDHSPWSSATGTVGSQRRCKWPLCGLRFAVSYASTGETSRLDSPMLPRQDPKGTDALWVALSEESRKDCVLHRRQGIRPPRADATRRVRRLG